MNLGRKLVNLVRKWVRLILVLICIPSGAISLHIVALQFLNDGGGRTIR